MSNLTPDPRHQPGTRVPATQPQLASTPEQNLNAELLRRVEELRRRQQTIFGNLTMSEEDRQALGAYQRRQHEALDATLAARNRGLKAMADAQASFIAEMANSLLLRDRATLKVDASEHFQAERLRLNQLIEHYGEAFYDLVERKLTDAENRPDRIREKIMDQVDADLNRWNDAVAQILNEYHALLHDRV